MELSQEQRFRFRLRLEQEQEQEQAQQQSVQQAKPYQPSLLDRVADVSSKAQNAVLEPFVKGASEFAGAFVGPEAVHYGMKGLGVVAKAISDSGDYIAEKGGELGVKAGYPKTGQALGVGLGAVVQNAPYMLIPSARGIPAAKLSSAVEGVAAKAEQSASSRWFKGLGGTLPHAKELGAEETLRLGRAAKNKGIITAWNSPESQNAMIEKLQKQSGERIGSLRGLGDLYTDSPEAKKIVQAIYQDVSPKYKTGIQSGEQGDLKKAIEEVLKLENVDKLTPTEEMIPRMQKGTIKNGVASKDADPFSVMKHSELTPQEEYLRFRQFQEDPNFIPEYDLHRPTTFNSVADVATKINKHAKSKSQMLQPSGADTDVANTVSRINDEALIKGLPPQKGLEYRKNLQDYGDLSKMDTINQQRLAYEVGGSRNSIVNNLANRIYHKFGHQLSATTLDSISNLLRQGNRSGVRSSIATGGIRATAMGTQRTPEQKKALMDEYLSRKSNGSR